MRGSDAGPTCPTSGLIVIDGPPSSITFTSNDLNGNFPVGLSQNNQNTVIINGSTPCTIKYNSFRNTPIRPINGCYGGYTMWYNLFQNYNMASIEHGEVIGNFPPTNYNVALIDAEFNTIIEGSAAPSVANTAPFFVSSAGINVTYTLARFANNTPFNNAPTTVSPGEICSASTVSGTTFTQAGSCNIYLNGNSTANGDYVYGAGIPLGTHITGGSSPTWTLSANLGSIGAESITTSPPSTVSAIIQAAASGPNLTTSSTLLGTLQTGLQVVDTTSALSKPTYVSAVGSPNTITPSQTVASELMLQPTDNTSAALIAIENTAIGELDVTDNQVGASGTLFCAVRGGSPTSPATLTTTARRGLTAELRGTCGLLRPRAAISSWSALRWPSSAGWSRTAQR